VTMTEDGERPDDDTPVAQPGSGAGNGAHVEYDLNDWAVESRQMLRALLAGDEIPHVWEAGRLVIPDAFEQRTDVLVDQVAATLAGALADTEAPQVVFDVSDLDDEVIEEITVALKAEHIDWLLEPSGELVVPAHHALSVEAILEKVDFPDALAADDGDGDNDDEAGLVEIDPDRVLGGLFVAADRLARHATDPAGVLDVVVFAQELADAALPFGFDPEVWQSIQSSSASLAAMIDDDQTSDEQVEQAASDLRSVLRDWV
jgi:hypothetical protein